MICLGIESSCDETALALVSEGRLVDSILATQCEVHALFGGVVPELASREHYRFLGVLYDTLMARSGVKAQDIDVYAVSRGPGLLGALLVGVAFAKGLALATDKPVLGVNHLHAHLLATGLEQDLPFPALGLLVSGGHTHLYRMESPEHFVVLGRTLDDAAGEAFDKVGKILGLPYPGGRIMDALARQGRVDAKLFPRPYLDNDNLDFSFSGLKTAASQYVIRQHAAHAPDTPTQNTHALDARALDLDKALAGEAPQALCDMCASFNAAVVDTLRAKTARALDRHPDLRTLVLAGGVAANSHLRAGLQVLMEDRGGRLLTPSPVLCTDNAAMVAYTGWLLAKGGGRHDLDFETVPRGKPIPEDMRRGPGVAFATHSAPARSA